MNLDKTKLDSLFTLIVGLHVLSATGEASREEVVRILTVGIRGQSRFSAADVLSGRTGGGPERRETPVTTDEGRRMTLVTGPNLCEEDVDAQTFTTALALSSPGPHAVLLLLNLEDGRPERCDVVSRVQELLGAEVLQYCIVLLHLKDRERFTTASGGIAGELIDACGGRFHVISHSKPKTAQTAALVAEIEKLVWLNGEGFYSVTTRESAVKESSRGAHGDSGGTVRWTVLISLNAALIFTQVRQGYLNFVEILFLLLSSALTLRNNLSPDAAVPFNLILSSTFTITAAYHDFSNSRQEHQTVMFLVMIFAFPSVVFIAGVGLILGAAVSIRTWSDVLIVCHAAPGVAFGAHLYTVYSIIPDRMRAQTTLVFALKCFLYCLVGVTLSVGFATVLAVFSRFSVGTIILGLILGFTTAFYHLKSDSVRFVIFFLIFPCCCAFIGCFIAFLYSILRGYIFQQFEAA